MQRKHSRSAEERRASEGHAYSVSGLKVNSVSERKHHMIYGLEPSAAAAAIHGTRFSGTVSTDLALITYVIISTAEQNMWRAEVLFGLFLSFS